LRRTAQIMAPAGLFVCMVVWQYIATVGVIFIAQRSPLAIPFELALATCSFFGLTALRRTPTFAVAWVGGTGVGTAIALYFPG
jgi:hypothetical protein